MAVPKKDANSGHKNQTRAHGPRVYWSDNSKAEQEKEWLTGSLNKRKNCLNWELERLNVKYLQYI